MRVLEPSIWSFTQNNTIPQMLGSFDLYRGKHGGRWQFTSYTSTLFLVLVCRTLGNCALTLPWRLACQQRRDTKPDRLYVQPYLLCIHITNTWDRNLVLYYLEEIEIERLCYRYHSILQNLYLAQPLLFKAVRARPLMVRKFRPGFDTSLSQLQGKCSCHVSGRFYTARGLGLSCRFF
jgi:hypothetical protein